MSLGAYVVRKLAEMIPTALGVTLLVFVLIRVLPGDPARTILGPRATPERIAILHERWGTDRPLPVQYERFVVRLLHGDVGSSLYYGAPSMGLVLERLPVTLWLAGAGALFALALAFPLAAVASAHPGGAVDHAVRAIPLVGLGFPSFWLGIMLLLAFALHAGRGFPVGGYGHGPFGHM